MSNQPRSEWQIARRQPRRTGQTAVPLTALLGNNLVSGDPNRLRCAWSPLPVTAEGA